MTTTPQVVTSYLAQLESALRGVEPGVRDEIVAGIREELQGLDAAASAARIEVLGDPEFIAAEARAASAVPVAPALATAPTQSNVVPVIIALVVVSGGFLLPVIGGIVGLALVTASRAWTRAEKLIAVLVPVGGVALDVIVSLATRSGYHSWLFVLLGLFIVDGVWLLVRVLRRG